MFAIGENNKAVSSSVLFVVVVVNEKEEEDGDDEDECSFDETTETAAVVSRNIGSRLPTLSAASFDSIRAVAVVWRKANAVPLRLLSKHNINNGTHSCTNVTFVILKNNLIPCATATATAKLFVK